MLEQITFLGLSCRRYNISLGWGNQPSTFSIDLVQDQRNGDLVNFPEPGTPVFFQHGTMSFNGLLQSWMAQGSSEGSPLFNATVVDPREILEGVQIICGDYAGHTYIPNVLNVFGFWENQEVGSSTWSEAGMKWGKIVEGINQLVNNQASPEYGGLISYKGFKYLLRMDAFSKLDRNYRIPASQLSLMDLLVELSDATSSNFFVALLNTQPYPTIEIVTQDMSFNPNLGLITNFIRTTPGAVSKSVGIENTQNIGSKMVLGAKKNLMYYTYAVDEDKDTYQDNYIQQFWGLDANENAIIPDSLGSFYIDTRELDIPGVPAFYRTDVDEVRCLIESQDDWENFLAAKSGNRYKFDSEGRYETCLYELYSLPNFDFPFKKDGENYSVLQFNAFSQADKDKTELNYDKPIFMPSLKKEKREQIGLKLAKESPVLFSARLRNIYRLLYESGSTEEIQETFVTYLHNGVENIHFGKYADLGVISQVGTTFMSDLFNSDIPLEDFVEEFSMMKYSPFSKTQIKSKDEKFTVGKNIAAVYQFLNSYVSAYYGKQFMVRLPFVRSYRDSETNIVYSNYTPVDSGFLDVSQLPLALSMRLIPQEISMFLDEFNKFTPYGRFDFDTADSQEYKKFVSEFLINKDHYSSSTMKTSELSDDEYVVQFWEQFTSAFVKCQVQPNLVYANFASLSDPRAVVDFSSCPFLGFDEDDLQQGVALEDIAAINNVFKEMAALSYYNKKSLEGDDVKGNIAEHNKNISQQLKTLFSKLGIDPLNFSDRKLFKPPTMVAIPLEMRDERYGPYYREGFDGKTELEIDDEINPWNFNGYQLMNLAGQAKVNTAVSLQNFLETGKVEYPGVPAVNLGRALITGGPYITNINVTVGEQGVTTLYDMSIWTPQWGKQTQANIQRAQRIAAKQRKDTKRNLRKNFYRKNAKYLKDRQHLIAKRDKYTSTHGIMMGDDKGNVFISPNYNVVNQIDSNNYNNIGGTSLDGLFTAFENNMYNTQTNLPKNEHFFSPFILSNPQSHENNFKATRGYQLNPFYKNDYPYVSVNGTDVNDGGMQENSPYVRSMALKGPVMIAGWGYNSNGTLTSEDPQDKSQWKTAPLDLIYDDYDKVWRVGESKQNIKAYAITPLGIPKYGVIDFAFRFEGIQLSYNGEDYNIANYYESFSVPYTQVDNVSTIINNLSGMQIINGSGYNAMLYRNGRIDIPSATNEFVNGNIFYIDSVSGSTQMSFLLPNGVAISKNESFVVKQPSGVGDYQIYASISRTTSAIYATNTNLIPMSGLYANNVSEPISIVVKKEAPLKITQANNVINVAGYARGAASLEIRDITDNNPEGLFYLQVEDK